MKLQYIFVLQLFSRSQYFSLVCLFQSYISIERPIIHSRHHDRKFPDNHYPKHYSFCTIIYIRHANQSRKLTYFSSPKQIVPLQLLQCAWSHHLLIFLLLTYHVYVVIQFQKWSGDICHIICIWHSKNDTWFMLVSQKTYAHRKVKCCTCINCTHMALFYWTWIWDW